MKKIILACLILVASNSFAQIVLNELTYEQSQNSALFKNVRNNTRILKYTAANGTVLHVGDTLVLGIPTGSVTSSTAIGAGDDVGIAKINSRTKSSFSTIRMGRPAGFGNVLNAMADEQNENASAAMQGENVLIAEMKVQHKGSRKKPLALVVLLGEINGRAFGINKYMSIIDFEKAVLVGEIKSLNAPLTREEAIAKLKEAKDLLDLEVIGQDEYDQLKKELTPIIVNK